MQLYILYVDGKEIYHTLDAHRLTKKIIALTRTKPQLILIEERIIKK